MHNSLRIVLLTAFMFGTTSALATSYQLDFGGQTSTGTYSGSLTLDYSDADVDPDPNRGNYSNLVTGLNLTINGINFTSAGFPPIFGFVSNDSNEFGDYFGIGGGVSNDDGGTGFFSIQFQNLDGSVFGSDALPSSLAFTDFDPFDVTNTNSTGFLFAIDGSPLEFIAMDFAELQPIPIPAGLWLFASAIGVALRFKSKS